MTPGRITYADDCRATDASVYETGILGRSDGKPVTPAHVDYEDYLVTVNSSLAFNRNTSSTKFLNLELEANSISGKLQF